MMVPIGLLDGFSPITIIFLGIVAVLLFGDRLMGLIGDWRRNK